MKKETLSVLVGQQVYVEQPAVGVLSGRFCGLLTLGGADWTTDYAVTDNGMGLVFSLDKVSKIQIDEEVTIFLQ